MTDVVTLQNLYNAYSKADEAFSVALANAFPKAWPGDVRYTAKGKGELGSPLRAAYDALQNARAAFHAAGGAEWLQGLLTRRSAA